MGKLKIITMVLSWLGIFNGNAELNQVLLHVKPPASITVSCFLYIVIQAGRLKLTPDKVDEILSKVGKTPTW